jgi:hypothetical protein
LSALELVPIFKDHRHFAVLVSFGLAFLYVEEAWAGYVFWSHRPLQEALILIGVIGMIVLVGYLASFLFPPLLISANWNPPRPWGVFVTVTAWSYAIVVIANVISYILMLYLTQFDLTASYILLRDVYAYAAFGMFFCHGLLLYVRYAQYLYTMPDFVQPIKIVAVSFGTGMVALIIAGFLFLLDLYHFQNVLPEIQPMAGLHLYGRALYAMTLAIAVWVWHLRWIADH